MPTMMLKGRSEGGGVIYTVKLTCLVKSSMVALGGHGNLTEKHDPAYRASGSLPE